MNNKKNIPILFKDTRNIIDIFKGHGTNPHGWIMLCWHLGTKLYTGYWKVALHFSRMCPSYNLHEAKNTCVDSHNIWVKVVKLQTTLVPPSTLHLEYVYHLWHHNITHSLPSTLRNLRHKNLHVTWQINCAYVAHLKMSIVYGSGWLVSIMCSGVPPNGHVPCGTYIEKNITLHATS
jgi:hypothetical protein